MNEYKYSLSKKGKAICPQCGKKSFVLYIDAETGQPLNENVGKCDRADNCGWHYAPKDYFKDNGIHFDTTEWKPQPMRQQPKKTASFIDIDVMKKTLSSYQENTLFSWMCSLDEEKTKEAFERYQVGTSKDGGTIFWEIDTGGKVRTGKLIHYKENGHRNKDVFPAVNWIHSLMKIDNFNLNQCFFGEHLLIGNNKPIGVIEGEKTALIASIYLPEFVWIACGGSEGLNLDKCKILRGKKVILFPDCGQLEKWQKKAEELKSICTIAVSDLVEKNATDEEKASGYDLADYLQRTNIEQIAPQEAPQEKAQPSEKVYSIIADLIFDDQCKRLASQTINPNCEIAKFYRTNGLPLPKRLQINI